MIIEIKPEQKKILDRAAKSGMSPDEVLDQAFAIIPGTVSEWGLESWTKRTPSPPRSRKGMDIGNTGRTPGC